MSQEPESAGRTAAPNSSAMIGWLGFFLLVFGVVGIAFYLAGDWKNPADIAEPAAVTQKTR